ncbi:type I-C CRISPR-associated protein Cas5c [Candidatus Bipolaricaulota bacterium]|nr:type I-C CRISPR-associated protein Cas5c [Candidatus Bipolaricaulota bacterium]
MDGRSGKIAVKVWGDYACFSRPEFKVERVSYPVITPSAARGILEAIFWKPELRYEIREIGILKMGTTVNILRNELSNRQGGRPIFIEDQRQQRTSLVLKDVEYLIRAEMVLRPHATDPIYKYLDQFRRRVERGQCYMTPYLGTREFAALFAPPADDDVPELLDLDLGLMLFDIAFVPDEERAELEFIRHGPDGPKRVKGYAQALFFRARVEKGWLHVPPEKYQELYRLEEGSRV